MNDVERDLRMLFERKAGSVGGVAPKLPETVRTRGRRRQLGTFLMSGTVVIALAVGSIGVLRALDPGQDRHPTPADGPWTGYEVVERTAVVHAFTITSPSDWYLVDQWRWARPIAADLPQEERVTPVLMLSNTDRGLTSSPCFDPSSAVGASEAVMTIAADDAYSHEHRGQADALPQAPTPFVTGGFEEQGPCGAGEYVRFATEDLPFVAHFLFGDDVSEEDRATLIGSFETMSARAVIDPNPIGNRRMYPSGAYVIAGGENAAGPWALELRPQAEPGYVTNVQLELVGGEGPGVMTGGPFTVGAERPIEQAGGDPVFGAVVKEADGVELRLEPGTPPIPARIVPLPPSMPFDFDLFFGSNDTDVQARAVALDARGDALGRGAGSPEPSLDGSSGDVVARFEAFGVPWAMVVDAPGPRCVQSLRNLNTGVSSGGSCGGPSSVFGPDDGAGDPAQAFLFGPLGDAVTAEVVTRDGRRYEPIGVGATSDGRRYFVIALEGHGPGVLRTLDAEGNVIERSWHRWRDVGQVIER